MIAYISSLLHGFFAKDWCSSPVVLVLLVGFIIQAMKVVIDIIRYKTFHRFSFFSSGWFPSFHTGLSSSVVMFVLLEYGVDSGAFMIAFCFGLLFAYDAMNIRYEAGQHAQYINSLRYELQWLLSPNKKNSALKERIGHTPLEVIGWIVLGSLITFVLYYSFYIK